MYKDVYSEKINARKQRLYGFYEEEDVEVDFILLWLVIFGRLVALARERETRVGM